MNTLGLSNRLGRIKEPNTMQIWKEVVGEYLTTISNQTTISNVSTSATTSSQDSTVLTEQDDKDNEGDADDDYHVVTTTLRQIIQDEHNLADIEQQLSYEQSTNEQTFQAFSRVLQVVIDMVNLYCFRFLIAAYYDILIQI